MLMKKRMLSTILCVLLLSVFVSAFGCGVNKTQYESKYTGSSINLFSNNSTYGLAYTLGTPVRFELTGNYNEENSDTAGKVTYRYQMKTEDVFAAVSTSFREKVDSINKYNTSDGGKLSEKDFNKGFRILYISELTQKTEKLEGQTEEKNYIYTTLVFPSMKNVSASNYSVKKLDSLTYSSNSVYNKFRDKENNIFSLATIEDKKDKFVLEVTIPTSSTVASEVVYVINGKVLAFYAENGAVLDFGDKSMQFTSASTGNLYICYSQGSTFPLTTVLLIAAALLVTAFLILIVIKITVVKKK